MFTMPCETDHKEDTMSVATASSPAPAVQDHTAASVDTNRGRWSARLSVLVEALAYAGASIDPASALAAQRFARVRDEELRRGRAGTDAA
jgi:hypothetical protein